MSRIVSKIRRLFNPPPQGYRPRLIDEVDHRALIAEAAGFFDHEPAEVARVFEDFRALHQRENYAERFGERKTLNFEEAFLINLMLVKQRPESLVEIGTQYGKSTRRIIDAIRALGLPTKVVCFDIEDQVKFFDPGEARLVLHDLTVDFERAVLQTIAPEAIYLDAHPYYLLRKVISEYLASDSKAIMAIHDCGVGLYNPKMTLTKETPVITSQDGLWERPVLAELFGIDDPGSSRLDDATTKTHRLHIFPTTHGLAVIRPLAPARTDR